MIISVIIPAYNDLYGVMTALNSLQQWAADNSRIQYIVQDDCSPACDMTLAVPPHMAMVHRNRVNLGFGGNCNEAARHAEGELLFFINQDVAAADGISNGWDEHLRNTFNDQPTVGIVGPKLLFPHDGSIQSAGGIFDANCMPLHRCLGYKDQQYPEVNTPMVVSWVTGAALAIRKDLFVQFNGFDPLYAPSYFEDVDICLKARFSGWQVYYQPQITLLHSVASTGGSPYFQRSALHFKERWVDTGKVTPDEQVVGTRYW